MNSRSVGYFSRNDINYSPLFRREVEQKKIERKQIGPAPSDHFPHSSLQMVNGLKRRASTPNSTVRKSLAPSGVTGPQMNVSKVWAAISLGSLVKLRKALQDVNIEDINRVKISGIDDLGHNVSMTCLHWAIYKKNEKLTRYLIEEKKADVDSCKSLQEEGGKPALFRVLGDDKEFLDGQDFSFFQFVQYLVSKGALLHEPFLRSDGVRGSLISYYAWAGDSKRLQFVVESLGADVNQVDSEGRTALYYALDKSSELGGDSEAMIELLADYNANINHADLDGNTLLMQFAKQGHRQAVIELLSHAADTTALNEKGENALACALNAYSEISLQDPQKLKDFKQIIGWLSKYESKNGLTRHLQQQMKSHHTQAVRILCQLGADVTCRDVYGATPLIYFAKRGLASCVKELLKKNVDVRAKDHSKKTALMYAESMLQTLFRGHKNRVSFLVTVRLLKAAK